MGTQKENASGKQVKPYFCFPLYKVLFKHVSHRITTPNLNIPPERLLILNFLFHFFLAGCGGTRQ